MSTDTWITRWIAHWRKRGADEDYARMSAEAWLESNPDDLADNPETVADEIFEEEMEMARQSM